MGLKLENISISTPQTTSFVVSCDHLCVHKYYCPSLFSIEIIDTKINYPFSECADRKKEKKMSMIWNGLMDETPSCFKNNFLNEKKKWG
jgi:hypothetical protein